MNFLRFSYCTTKYLKRIFSPLLEQEFYLIEEFKARRLASEKIAFIAMEDIKAPGWRSEPFYL